MALSIDPATLAPSGWWKADTLTGADGSLVSTWPDSSGNARDLAQSTAGYKPRLRLWQDANNPSSPNGTHKAVRFDGADDFLQSSANLSALLGTNGVGTILAVVRFAKGTVPTPGWYGILGVNAANGTKLSLRYDATKVFQAENNDGSSEPAAIAAPSPTARRDDGIVTAPIAPGTRVVVWRHTPSAIQVAVDNLDDVAFVETASGATVDLANALLVGRTYEDYWQGDVFEVIAFPTVLSEANLRGVGLYLSAKYGIAYESGIASEANPAAAMLVEMKLPATELTLTPSLWLKADAITGLVDGNGVAAWLDASGNGKSVAQSTAGYRPLYKTNIINGLPAVLFDGGDDFLASTSLLSDLLAAGGAGTVYVVARSTAAAHDQTLFSDSGATTHLTVRHAAAELQAANDDGSADVTSKPHTLGTWALMLWQHHQDDRNGATAPTYLYAGVNAFEWANLGEVASGATTAAVLANVLQVGRGAGYFEGYIAEVLFFPKSHAITERRHVWNYLAAKYALTAPTKDCTVWVDVTPDVRCSKGLQFRRGIEGPDAKDRVASGGELALVMENSTLNSAELQGYYSPENANVRDGFRVGTPVRVGFTHYGTTYYKWQGSIINVRVVPGAAGAREVSIRAADWMDYAGRVTLSGIPIQLDARADQLIAALYVYVPRVPESVCVDKGSDVYPYGLDATEDEGVLILKELHRLTLSELGYTYIRGDTIGGGQLRFEPRGVRSGTPVRWAMGETELEVDGLELSDHGLDGVINRVVVELHPRRVDAGTSTVLFSLGNAPLIGADPVTFTAPYRDPAGGSFARVGGMNMVTPVATTDYTLNSAEDGSGSDLTANFTVSAVFGGNSAQVTVTKNTGADGYLTKCELRGRGVYAFESILVDVQDATSVAAYGQQTQPFDMPYQSDVNLAKTVADLLLANNKDPRTKVRRVSFMANASSTHMMHALARDIGDRITISENMSGLAAEAYFIQAVEFDVWGGDIIRASWQLVPADQEVYPPPAEPEPPS